MDGIPVLDLWEFVLEVFHSSQNQTNNPVQGTLLHPKPNKRTQKRTDVSIQHDKSDVNYVDHVSSNTRLSIWCDVVFLKTMRRFKNPPSCWDMCRELTESLWTGCLKELTWIQKSKSNMLTPNTNSQTLTERNFTRDEWNNLLYLCNIRHFSSQCCIQNFSLTSCNKMAKRSQSQEDGRIVPRSRPSCGYSWWELRR